MKRTRPKKKRKNRKKSKRGPKKSEIQIHHIAQCSVPRAQLPEDAQFKGHRSVVIQNIRLQAHNTQFNIARHYSPSLHQTLEGALPAQYQESEFGPELRAFILMLYFQGRVTENKIQTILHGMNISISGAQLSRIITHVPKSLTSERDLVRQAAMSKADYVQMDDTGAKIHDRSASTIVVCNEYFTNYTTGPSKDRLSVVSALMGGEENLQYQINRTTRALLRGKISKRSLNALKQSDPQKVYSQKQFEQDVLSRAWIKQMPPQSREEFITACAIAGYRGQPSRLKPSILVSDDGTNFKGIFRRHGLCWIHELRRYREVFTLSDYHRGILDRFLERGWKLYRRIQAYQKSTDPDPLERKSIEAAFDDLFSEKTSFHRIDEILPLTMKRKRGLLLGLQYPHIPLHNNTSETDLKERVIKRTISYGNRSYAGVKAWDIYLGLLHTCRKLGVSFWDYLKDRLCLGKSIPPLNQLISAD